MYEQKLKPLPWYDLLILFIFLTAIIFGFLWLMRGMFVNAQTMDLVNGTSTGEITLPSAPIILTDSEKLQIAELDLTDKNSLASKYASLYDGCKNLKSEIQRDIKNLELKYE